MSRLQTNSRYLVVNVLTPTTCNRMAESSSAETSTGSHFSGSNHSTNFCAYTSEVESDSEVNWSEANPSSQVVSLLNRLKTPTLADIANPTIICCIVESIVLAENYFNPQQGHALKDYSEASLMLRFNKH